MHRAALRRGELFGYGAFALPLAMAALPVYVHLPKLYAEQFGLSLALIGVILLACRLLDALQDPLLGMLSDRMARQGRGRAGLMLASVPLLAAGMLALFHPPAAGVGAPWLAAGLVVTYLGFSLGAISYYAMGAEMAQDYHQRTRVTAVRGALGMAGVLLAAALPQWLETAVGARRALEVFSYVFVPVLVVAALVTARAGRGADVPPVAPQAGGALRVALRSSRFRWLIATCILSGIAGAIPATLILFFVDDVLRAPQLGGLFLGLYFVFAALAMPLWVALARVLGKKRAWQAGMLLSLLAFAWAYLLGAGDALAFGAICALSGVAYGAELALPPSILADIVQSDAGGRRAEGTYFGVWQMIEKLTLALAAGAALPLLQWLGYGVGTAQAAGGALSTVYALIPCAIKLAALACLALSPLESARRGAPHLPTEEALSR